MYASLKTSTFLYSLPPQIYYPINNTLIGGGQQNDVTFYAHTSTNFTFPFSIEYTTTMSSSPQIIADLAQKCGLEGGAVSDITVDYEITVSRVLNAGVNLQDLITFSSTSWVCACFSSQSRRRSVTLPVSCAL